jgi:hypothetical protein
MKHLVTALFLLLPFSADAVEVAGVQVPDTVSVQDNELALAGAGVRSKFFVKVYVGALYIMNLNDRGRDGVLAQAGPKSVRLHFLYKELAPEKLIEAWNDGFAANHSEAELSMLKPRIALFNAMFPAVKRGDVVRLDLLNNGRTDVWINDTKRGAVAGTDFQQALLKIWIGDKPVDKDLKTAMLGE